MVDARDEVLELRRRQPEIRRQLPRRVLHRVAEPDGADRAGLGDGPAQHRHRVDVVEQQRVRAELLEVAAHVEQHRDRPQAAHDPADADRVTDRLPQAVPLGNLEVDDGRRPVAADLERRDDVVGAVERRAPVERGLDGRRGAVCLGQPARDDLRCPQPLGVDVHEREGRRVAQLGQAQDVADEVAREHRGARSDEGDLRHQILPRVMNASQFSTRDPHHGVGPRQGGRHQLGVALVAAHDPLAREVGLLAERDVVRVEVRRQASRPPPSTCRTVPVTNVLLMA